MRLKTEANKSQFIRKVSSPVARSHVRGGINKKKKTDTGM